MQYLKFNSPIRNLQVFLRTISRRYPAIPTVVPDGIYGENTQNAVRAFQREFGINSTGITNNSTWDKIFSVYMQTEQIASSANPVKIYPAQSVGNESPAYTPTITIMQSMLYAISEKFSNISAPTLSGELDFETRNSIKSLQLACGLNPDGNPSKNFLNYLTVVYETYISGVCTSGSRSADNA